MLVDNPLILRKSAELEKYYNQIGEYAHISPDEYIADWKVLEE